MQDFLIYDAKVAVLIVVFYMFYRLLLARESFHRVNRAVLLLTAVASFVLPLCVITMHKTVTVAMPAVTIGELQMAVEPDEAQPVVWQIILPYIYIIGVAVTLGYTLVSILKVELLIKRCEKHPQDDGTTICVTGNAQVAPFSWMRSIVMNRDDYAAQDAAILAHERGHIRLRHSWDVVLVDLLTALQWFNPAMWMLRQDLRAIHEYEADGEVLSQGINARQYQYLLITKAASIGGYSIANGISHSTLKNRITMMTNNKSRRRSLIKLLALIPIVGIALALNARTVTDYVYDEPQKQVPVKKGVKKGTIKTGTQKIEVVEAKKTDVQLEYQDESGKKTTETGTLTYTNSDNGTPSGDVFDVVEVMPQFPGGPQELFNFLAKNIKYPAEAENAGKQGRVIVTFVVSKDGSIRDTRVVKSVDPLLDAEGLRVINSMPNWTPGTQSGKAVNVKYTVPITFRLDGGKPKETPTATGSFTPAETPQELVVAKIVDNVAVNDLVKKLPGAKVDENGNVTINGKPIKKILVDGKPVEDMSKAISPKYIKVETDDVIIMTKE